MHDITQGGLAEAVGEPVDVVTMVFVLSALAPETHVAALRNAAAALRPGGLVLFRDYGLYDAAMLRFKVCG